MTTAVEAKIVDILCKAVDGVSPGFTMAWPNSNFVPVVGQEFLKVSVMFADSDQPSVPNDGHRRYQGILQLSLFSPRGGGMVASANDLGSLLENFERGTRLTNDDGDPVVEIGQTPSLNAPMQDDPWWHQPCTIPWFALVSD